MNQRQVLDQVQAWATDDENIRAAVLTGSLALSEEKGDPFSDLDIELYAVDTGHLLARTEWYRQFGEVLVVEALDNPGWYPTRLVYYVDGKVDFAIADVSALRMGAVYDHPFRVLIDKDGLASDLRLEPRKTTAPKAQEFGTCINWFYAAALMCAKAIVRNEPWMAKVRDWDLKRELLRMIEWDHKRRYGWDYDTWHLGVHMRQWMDADVADALNRCWAGFPVEEARRALMASVELFERVSSHTGKSLRLPPFPSNKVRSEIERILRMEARP